MVEPSSLSFPFVDHPLSRLLALFPEPVSCIGLVTGIFYLFTNSSASEEFITRSTESYGRTVVSLVFLK